MPREVTGSDGIVWSCVEAYAGLPGEGGNAAASLAADGLSVVCAPSGGAKSVRLELPAEWEESFDDEQLLREIKSRRETWKPRRRDK